MGARERTGQPAKRGRCGRPAQARLCISERGRSGGGVWGGRRRRGAGISERGSRSGWRSGAGWTENQKKFQILGGVRLRSAADFEFGFGS